MEARSAFPQNSRKCPDCGRNGIRLGIEAARSPVWLCVECDCYWYWLKGQRVIADLLTFGAGI